MIVEKIKYKDYNGVEKERDLYFNLTQAEVVELEVTTNGGYSELIKTAMNNSDQATIFNVFKKLLLLAYGEKSVDGETFEKGGAITERFLRSEAYSTLIMRMFTNPEYAADFFNRLTPSAGESTQVVAPAASN